MASLYVNGKKVAWTLTDYVDDLQTKMTAALSDGGAAPARWKESVAKDTEG